VPKIKGTHTAMKSGMLAAEAIAELLLAPAAASAPAAAESASAAPAASAASALEPTRYTSLMEASWVWPELRAVRNYHPAFAKGGLLAGVAYSAVSAFVTGGREPWTWHNDKPDSARTLPAAQCAKIAYPKPDGVLSFDLLTNLARSGTSHEADQPPHLRIKPGSEGVPADVSHAIYAGPESRFCPAKVYEYPDEATGKLVINAQNCVHCKTCDIKMPRDYIKWTVPESGGGGPAYEVM